MICKSMNNIKMKYHIIKQIHKHISTIDLQVCYDLETVNQATVG